MLSSMFEISKSAQPPSVATANVDPASSSNKVIKNLETARHIESTFDGSPLEFPVAMLGGQMLHMSLDDAKRPMHMQFGMERRPEGDVPVCILCMCAGDSDCGLPSHQVEHILPFPAALEKLAGTIMHRAMMEYKKDHFGISEMDLDGDIYNVASALKQLDSNKQRVFEDRQMIIAELGPSICLDHLREEFSNSSLYASLEILPGNRGETELRFLQRTIDTLSYNPRYDEKLLTIAEAAGVLESLFQYHLHK